MTTPAEILEATRSFVAARATGGSLSENTGALYAAGQFDQSFLDGLGSLVAACERLGLQLEIVNDLGPIVVGEVTEHLGEIAQLIIRKPNTATTFYQFTMDGYRWFLNQEPETSRARRVQVNGLEETFSTETCRYQQWTEQVADDEVPNPIADILPRRYVRDLGKCTPATIGEAILKSDPPLVIGETYRTWQHWSLKRLSCSLVTETLPDGKVAIKGDRTVTVDASIPVTPLVSTVEITMQAARWVFVESTDIELRHMLFTNELAREWSDGSTWLEGMGKFAATALEAAKHAYRKHLSGTANETLKALTELRKALNEEVSKVNQQTRDAIGALWRDFAIALAAIVAHFAVSESTQGNPQDTQLVLWVAAGYLTIVLLTTAWSNGRFRSINSESRKEWGTRLYSFLSKPEYDALALQPLKKADGVFLWTAWIIGGVYVITIAGLIWFALAVPKSVENTRTANTGAVVTHTALSPQTSVPLGMKTLRGIFQRIDEGSGSGDIVLVANGKQEILTLDYGSSTLDGLKIGKVNATSVMLPGKTNITVTYTGTIDQNAVVRNILVPGKPLLFSTPTK